MRRNGLLSLRIVDALCGAAVAACLFVLVWYTLFREDCTQAEIRSLTQRIHRIRGECRRLRAEGQRQQAILATYREDLATTGQLPTETPIERYFQTLSQLAADHELRVVRHQPLASLEYPGLLEHRYAYEVTGSFPSLVAFLKSIEDTDFWADVSYLKFEGGNAHRKDAPDERTAQLTISLFSAPPAEPPAPVEATPPGVAPVEGGT